MTTTVEHSQELGELTKALVAAQAEFPAIPKTSENPFFKSKYADLADVKAITVPITTKHGLAVTQHPSHSERGDTLVTMLLHTSGQFIKAEMELHLTKTDAQGQGSAMTYARRYAYMAALDLVADEDDDGNQAPPVKRLKSEMAAAKGLLFVAPEYNRSISGVLKNALDYVYVEWNYKAAGFGNYRRRTAKPS